MGKVSVHKFRGCRSASFTLSFTTFIRPLLVLLASQMVHAYHEHIPTDYRNARRAQFEKRKNIILKSAVIVLQATRVGAL